MRGSKSEEGQPGGVGFRLGLVPLLGRRRAVLLRAERVPPVPAVTGGALSLQGRLLQCGGPVQAVSLPPCPPCHQSEDIEA